MSFRIVTTASYDYAKTVDFCLPSWRRNSGADDIVIRWHEPINPAGRAAKWFEAVKERVTTMRDAVRLAVVKKRKLLFLDADCLVVRDVSDGFAKGKPIAVARWPRINMGVMFLNTDMDWPFLPFFELYASKSLAHIDEQIANHSERNGTDQDVITPMLGAIEADVAKLDKFVWNLPMSEDPKSREVLEEHSDTVRIVHLRVGTSFGGNVDRFAYIKKMFQGIL